MEDVECARLLLNNGRIFVRKELIMKKLLSIKFIHIALAACFSVFAVGCNLPESTRKGNSEVVLSETNSVSEFTEREIYRSDFNSGAHERFTATNGAKAEVVDFNGEKVLKCSDRGAWWSQISLDLSGLVQKDCDYEVKCEIYFEGAEKADCTVEWFDDNGADTVFSKGLRTYYSDPNEWAELWGYSFIPCKVNPVLNFRQVGEATFYVKNVVINQIDLNASAVAEMPSLKTAAEKHGILFGTIIGDDRLDDENYETYINTHCATVSCGNYGYIDYEKTVEAAKTDPDAMPVSYYGVDKYFEYAKAHNLTVRGPALMHDGSQYEWLFHEQYDVTKPYVSAEVMKRRMKTYITEFVTHLETKYPGVARSYDVINECVDLGEGAFEEGDNCCIRKKGNGWHTVLGKDYVKYAYSYAREALNGVNSKAKLFYNDWGTNGAAKRDAIINMLNWLNDGNMLDGVNLPQGTKLIDGMGMEGYRAYESYRGAIAYELLEDDANSEAKAVRIYNEAGVEVNYSELTFKNSDNSLQGNMTHARYIYAWFRTLLKANEQLRAEGYAGITLINMWGCLDCPYLQYNDYSTGLTGTHCGVMDYKFGVKPSFYALEAALNGKAFPCD